MQWLFAGKSSKNVSIFHLVVGNTIVESVRYHSIQHSIRVKRMESHRVFFVNPTGFGDNQFSFTNEYGFDMGRVDLNHAQHEGGTIEYSGITRQYTLLHHRIPEIIIYEEGGLTPAGICDLKHFLSMKDSPSIIENAASPVYACLIWSFQWYLLNFMNAEVTSSAKDLIFA